MAWCAVCEESGEGKKETEGFGFSSDMEAR
jgi:hypothetical protein